MAGGKNNFQVNQAPQKQNGENTGENTNANIDIGEGISEDASEIISEDLNEDVSEDLDEDLSESIDKNTGSSEGEKELENVQQDIQFSDIQKRAKKADDFNDAFIENAKENSRKKDREQARLDDKKCLEGMAKLYRLWADDDKDFSEVLSKIDELAQKDIASGSGYWNEGNAYNDIIQKTEKYIECLEKQEQKLQEKSAALLKTKVKSNGPGEPETFEWYTDEDLEDPKLENLKKQSNELKRHADLLDKKKAMAFSVLNVMNVGKNGKLSIAHDEEETNISSHEKARNRQIYRYYTGHSLYNAGIAVGKAVYGQSDRSSAPLFPHEPNANDISQGYIGDCYYITALSNIARLYPEKIKESMVDNMDGTVTVRLFGKDEYGKHYPVYVTVDKVVPTLGLPGMTQLASNCLWVNCFEKALAVSGLYNSYEADGMTFKPVPEDIEQRYEEYKQRLSGGDLNQQQMEEEYRRCPWLFARDPKSRLNLVPWPNMDSIKGGRAGSVTELLLGDGFENEEVMSEDIGAYNESYLNVKPVTPAQFFAVALANRNGNMLTDNYDIPVNKLDLSLPYDQLFEQAFSVSGIGKEPGADINAYKTIEKNAFDNNVNAFTDFIKRKGYNPGKLTFHELIPLAKDFFAPYAQKPDVSDNRDFLSAWGIVNNLIPLMDKEPYTEKQIDLYNRIKNCELHGALVTVGTKKTSESVSKVPGPHSYTVLGVYTDSLGRRMVKLKNPWNNTVIGGQGVDTVFHDDGTRTYINVGDFTDGEFEMELKDLVRDSRQFEFNGYNKVYDKILLNEDIDKPESHIGIKDIGVFGNDESIKESLLRSLLYSLDPSGGHLQSCMDMNFTGEKNNVPFEDLKNVLAKSLKADGVELSGNEFSKFKGDVIFWVESAFYKVKNNYGEFGIQTPRNKAEFCRDVISEITSRVNNAAKSMVNINLHKPYVHMCRIFKNNVLDLYKNDAEALVENGSTKSTEKTERLYNELKEKLKNRNITIRLGTEKKVPIVNESTQQSEPQELMITDISTDSNGIKRVTLTNVDDKYKNNRFAVEISLAELCDRADRLYIVEKDMGIKYPKPPKKEAEEKTFGKTVDDKSFLAYVEALDKIWRDFRETDRIIFDNSSQQYTDLRNGVRDCLKDISLMNGDSSEKMQSKINSLEKLVTGYEEHCSERVIDNLRRNTRLKTVSRLKDVIGAVKNRYKNPMQYRREQLALRISDCKSKCLADIKEAFEKNNPEKIVNGIANLLCYSELSQTAVHAPLSELEEKLDEKNFKYTADMLKPMVASVAASMKKDALVQSVQSGSITALVSRKVQHDYTGCGAIKQTTGAYKTNLKKLSAVLKPCDKQPVKNGIGIKK